MIIAIILYLPSYVFARREDRGGAIGTKIGVQNTVCRFKYNQVHLL